MREIKFRGRHEGTTDCWVWIYGYLSKREDVYLITNRFGEFIVVEHTIGQFTGLMDKNYTEIYEGDIVDYYGIVGTIVYKNNCLCMKLQKNPNQLLLISDDNPENIEVMGNIYEHKIQKIQRVGE
jgi:hypothetical protein